MPNFFLSYKRAKVAAACHVRLENGRVAPDLRQTRRDTAKGPPDSAPKLPPGINRAKKTLGGPRGVTGATAMKLFTTWVVSAGLVLAATAADAQVSAPRGAGSAGYTAVSDVDGP